MSEELPPDRMKTRKLAPAWRSLIEICFIVFLYYSNLLMGEYERAGQGRANGLAWAVRDILTGTNFAIAIATALIGYLVIEFLRKRF
jgi:hypothetical protein